MRNVLFCLSLSGVCYELKATDPNWSRGCYVALVTSAGPTTLNIYSKPKTIEILPPSCLRSRHVNIIGSLSCSSMWGEYTLVCKGNMPYSPRILMYIPLALKWALCSSRGYAIYSTVKNKENRANVKIRTQFP